MHDYVIVSYTPPHHAALATEGIFRMSGSVRRIADLQSIFNTPEDYGAKFDWEHGKYTVHDAANVMRRFLNHLPEPVIPLDYYRPFKEAYGKYRCMSCHDGERLIGML